MTMTVIARPMFAVVYRMEKQAYLCSGHRMVEHLLSPMIRSRSYGCSPACTAQALVHVLHLYACKNARASTESVIGTCSRCCSLPSHR